MSSHSVTLAGNHQGTLATIICYLFEAEDDLEHQLRIAAFWNSLAADSSALTACLLLQSCFES